MVLKSFSLILKPLGRSTENSQPRADWKHQRFEAAGNRPEVTCHRSRESGMRNRHRPPSARHVTCW